MILPYIESNYVKLKLCKANLDYAKFEVISTKSHHIYHFRPNAILPFFTKIYLNKFWERRAKVEMIKRRHWL